MPTTFTIVVEDRVTRKRKTETITTRMSVDEILRLWRNAGWDIISVNK